MGLLEDHELHVMRDFMYDLIGPSIAMHYNVGRRKKMCCLFIADDMHKHIIERMQTVPYLVYTPYSGSKSGYSHAYLVRIDNDLRMKSSGVMRLLPRHTRKNQKILFDENVYIRTVYMLSPLNPEMYSCASIKGVYYTLTYDRITDTWQITGEAKIQKARPAIPRKIREAVFERDNYQCLMCGAVEHLELDHIILYSRGGSSDIENLRVLCKGCNLAMRELGEPYVGGWNPKAERALAQRLLLTITKRYGYTYKHLVELTGLRQQSITILVKKRHGSWQGVKAIEKLAMELLPDLTVLIKLKPQLLGAFISS